MGGAAADCSSPRVLPEDLRRQYPSFDDCGATHDALTMEELLAVDGVRRALRVVEQLLQGKPFFGGSTTNALDAVVFAHLAILFSLPLPGMYTLRTTVGCNVGHFLPVLQVACELQLLAFRCP